MQHGRQNQRDRQDLLFLNYAFFGNTKNSGSCSASYFLKNSNANKPTITSKDIFEKFKKTDFYQKHQKEIDDLEQEFNNLSKYGNLIQLAVPEKHLNKHLYLTISGGEKKYAEIKKENTINTYRTNSIPEILTILKTNPEKIVDSDKKEFAWVATEDTIQKAMVDGVQIRSFNTADPEKFDAVMRKVDAVLEKLAQEDSQQPMPTFKSQPTPWECYKMHKESFKKIDKNHL